MNEDFVKTTEAYVEAWHGITPPNDPARRLAKDLAATIAAFEAQRDRLRFEGRAQQLRSRPPGHQGMNHLSLTEAAEAVATRRTTATALLQSCLAAIDAHEHQVNATIWIDRDGALQTAEAADRAVAAGAPSAPSTASPSPTRTCTTRPAASAPAAP